MVLLSLIDFMFLLCVSPTVCEETTIRPGKCQRQRQDQHKSTKTRPGVHRKLTDSAFG